MNDFSTLLAVAVRRYRKSHGLSQDEFAQKVNTSKTSIVGLEAKRRLPRIDTLNAIWALLDPPEATNVARETQPTYNPGQPYLHWLQQLIESDTPYPEKVQAIRDTAALELQRLPKKDTA